MIIDPHCRIGRIRFKRHRRREKRRDAKAIVKAQIATAHLNLTRSLADAWFGPEPEPPKAPVYLPPQRAPYAGYDPRENRLW